MDILYHRRREAIASPRDLGSGPINFLVENRRADVIDVTGRCFDE